MMIRYFCGFHVEGAACQAYTTALTSYDPIYTEYRKGK